MCEFSSSDISSCQVRLVSLRSSECISVNRWGTRALFEAQLWEGVRVLRFSSCPNTCFFVSWQQKLCVLKNHAQKPRALIAHHNKTAYEAIKKREKHFPEANNFMFWLFSVIVWFVCPESLTTFKISCTALYLCLPLISSARLRPWVIIRVNKKKKIQSLPVFCLSSSLTKCKHWQAVQPCNYHNSLLEIYIYIYIHFSRCA